MSVSAKAGQAFANYYKLERQRSEACLERLFDVLMADGAPLTEREERIVECLIAHWKREPDPTDYVRLSYYKGTKPLRSPSADDTTIAPTSDGWRSQ